MQSLLRPRLATGARCLLSRRLLQRNLTGLIANAAASGSPSAKKRVVFLGTPEVAAIVLQELLVASRADDASFELTAVVSQPGKPKGRGNKGVPTPSPVEAAAREAGVPDAAILCPRSARDPGFLEAFAALRPDLAVTAAYGNMLPQAFLDVPVHGTLNVHPSLLPAYRGAAPVQRALQDGVRTTGVSVAFTVLACDAGPVFLQEAVDVPEDEQAPELLARLFRRGAQLLVAGLPRVWSGDAATAAAVQDHAAATHAAKISREEASLDLRRPAQQLHDQVRAFAGWPGTYVNLVAEPAGSDMDGSAGGSQQPVLQVKVLRTRVAGADTAQLLAAAPPGRVVFTDGSRRMLLPCGDGGALEVLLLQPPTKKAMEPRAFANGLAGKQLRVLLHDDGM